MPVVLNTQVTSRVLATGIACALTYEGVEHCPGLLSRSQYAAPRPVLCMNTSIVDSLERVAWQQKQLHDASLIILPSHTASGFRFSSSVSKIAAEMCARHVQW